MTAEQLGWVAGFLEGEGCFRVSGQARCKRLQMRITATQAGDAESLERLCEYTNAGRITGPYEDSRPNTRTQPYYVWTCTRKDDVARIMEAVFPLMSSRRQDKIQKVFMRRSESCQ